MFNWHLFVFAAAEPVGGINQASAAERRGLYRSAYVN